MDVAAGPIATELAPVAVESARVELAWKYLIPRPLASALRVDRPVDSEPTPLWAVLMPLDDEVESDVTLLLVVERPLDEDVESDATALFVVERPVESEPTLL
jgi:hypothetical protein